MCRSNGKYRGLNKHVFNLELLMLKRLAMERSKVFFDTALGGKVVGLKGKHDGSGGYPWPTPCPD
jgi:hypothetical protein